MKNVRLSVKDDEDKLVESIDAVFEDSDLTILQNFSNLLARVRVTTLLTRGMPAIGNINTNRSTGLTFTCSPYSDSELHELLHVLRPVILEKEPASFKKVSALINRRFKNKNLSNYLKVQRQLFEDGELAFYMQIRIEDKPLFHESLLHLWLNAEQYHTDPEKSSAWQQLKSSLEPENVRALVMNQLHGKVKALFNLEYIAKLILDKPDVA